VRHLQGQLGPVQRGDGQGGAALRALHRDSWSSRSLPAVPADRSAGGEPVHPPLPGHGDAGAHQLRRGCAGLLQRQGLFILDVRLDYRISCLLSIFKREFDESEVAASASSNEASQQQSQQQEPQTPGSSNETDPLDSAESVAAGAAAAAATTARQKNIDLESIGVQAEGIFDCERSDAANLDLDGQGGRTFLRVLLHLIMHDYAPLVSGALHLLFRHFSQRQEVLQAFRQVRYYLLFCCHVIFKIFVVLCEIISKAIIINR